MSTDNDSRVVGWKLAKRVADSTLYDQLNDLEMAECNELIARGNGSEGPPDKRAPDGVACRLSRCLYQGDCSRIRYCQAVIFQSGGYRQFICNDLMPTLRQMIEQATEQGADDRVLSQLQALLQRASRTI
jgi:hypothetical protein